MTGICAFYSILNFPSRWDTNAKNCMILRQTRGPGLPPFTLNKKSCMKNLV